MIKVIKINPENGRYIEDVILGFDSEGNPEQIPYDCISIPCPDGFYIPMWNGIEWREGATAVEIARINNVVIKTTLSDRVDFLENVVNGLMDGGLI